MDSKALAAALVDGCREGREMENLDRLYSPDAVSVEPVDHSGTGREASGIDAIKAKHTWWDENMTVHSAKIRGPFFHGDDRFGLIFEIDAEDKASGQRHEMEELAIYSVADGKIIREEFFY